MKVKYYCDNTDKTFKVKVLHQDGHNALVVVPPKDKYECYAIVIVRKVEGDDVWRIVHEDAYVNFEE